MYNNDDMAIMSKKRDFSSVLQKYLSKYSSLFGLNFIHKLSLKDISSCNSLYIAKVYAERSLYSQAKQDGFQTTNINSDYNWILYKKVEHAIFIELKYEKGFVSLAISYQRDL